MSRLCPSGPIALNLLTPLPSSTGPSNLPTVRARPVSKHSLPTPSMATFVPRPSSTNPPNRNIRPSPGLSNQTLHKPPGVTHLRLATARSPALHPLNNTKPDPWLLLSPRGQEELQKKAEAKGEWRYEAANGMQKKERGVWKYDEVNLKTQNCVAEPAGDGTPTVSDLSGTEIATADRIDEEVHTVGEALKQGRSATETEILAKLQVAMAGMSLEQSNRKLSEVMILVERGVGTAEILQYLADFPPDERMMTELDLQMPTAVPRSREVEDGLVCYLVRGLEDAAEKMVLVSPKFNPAVASFVPAGASTHRSGFSEIAAAGNAPPAATTSSGPSTRHVSDMLASKGSFNNNGAVPDSTPGTIFDLVAGSTDDLQRSGVLSDALNNAYDKRIFIDQYRNRIPSEATEDYQQQLVHMQWEATMAWQNWYKYWAEQATAVNGRAAKYAEDLERWMQMDEDEFCYCDQEVV